MTSKKINPVKLFSKGILNYQVKTKRLGKVSYVNLDNAATTPPFLSVQKAVDEYLKSYGSVHRGAGTKSKISTDIYEDSRRVIKEFVGAQEDSYVMFTGNTTGAMNMAAYFFSFLKGKVAVSEIEHSSSWLPWIKAEGEKALGCKQVNFEQISKINKKIQLAGQKMVLRYSLNKNSEFDLKSIENILKNNKIKAFVLTASSNLSGYSPNIKKIGELVHRYGAYYIVDACQFLQHHQINMVEMGIDFLAASGHKFYSPYGGGFLIGPKKFLDEFLPYQIGGGNLPYITKEGVFLRHKNQLAHDPGTPNALGAISMAAAFKELQALGIKNIQKYESELTKRAFEEMKKNKKIKLLVKKKHLSTVIPFVIEDQDSQLVAERLNKEFGIGVRAGSFCVYDVVRNLLKIDDESEIIESVNRGDISSVPSVIRVSFSLCNSLSDVTRFIKALNFIIATGISEKQKEEWRELLRQIPVAVNNFYGDPVIQWQNTLEKLDRLIISRHSGPVGIITKGRLNEVMVKELQERQKKGLKIVVLVSISELKNLEGTGSEHRYQNLKLLRKAGVPALAYIRPMIPPFNTSEEVISDIFAKLKKAKCKMAVASGFRGDESLVRRLSPDERVQWAMRVKVMPGEVFRLLKKHAEKNKVQLFTRTACAISVAVGDERTYNPYYNSRNLVKCKELNCPLLDTCGPLDKPREGSLEFLRYLGFAVEFIPAKKNGQVCDVSGENRLKCPSCCTTCYFSKNIPHILVKGDVNLGALAFIRFVSGMMAMQPGRNDDGRKDIGKVKFPNYPEIDNAQSINSWWPFARNLKKCFGCKYCIVSEYYNENTAETGFPPAELVDRLFAGNDKNNNYEKK